MKKANHTLLLHPFFIISLLLLLLNDFVLKGLLHNWFTGKLSDVAGIAVFAMFFTSLFPQHKNRVYPITAILFIWFKSPMAQPLINYVDITLSLPIHRVVDYTDDAALLILFFTWRLKPLPGVSLYKKIAAYAVGGVSVFAFCATEAPLYLQRRGTAVYMYSDYKTTLTEQGIMHRLDSLHIGYTRDSFEVNRVYYTGNYLYSTKDSVTGQVKYVYIPNDSATALFHNYPVQPYITIVNFITGNDTIPKIKLSTGMWIGRKKRYIRLERIELTSKDYNTYVTSPGSIRRNYRKLVYDGVIKKLQ